ncbi:MAG: terminase small subunit [Candidatus Cryptobacteroides sp.]
MEKLLYIYNLPEIDLDDAEAIKQRIQDYFDWTISAEVKPSFASLALAIGVDRKTLLAWENEETRKGSGYSDIIKKAKALITSIVEDNGTEGRVNPVYTMFLLNSSAQGYSNNSRVEITNAPAEQIDAPKMDDIIDIYMDGDTDSDSRSDNQ